MIYSGSDTLDFADKALISFAQQASLGDKWNPKKYDVEGYTRSSAGPIEIGIVPAPPEGWAVRWTILQTWEFYKRGPTGYQKVGETNIRVQAHRMVDVLTSVALLVRDGLPQTTVSKIEAIFASYNYPSSGDVDAFIEQAVAQDATLSPLMIGLSNIITVMPVADAVYDKREEEFLRRWIGASSGDDVYDLRLVRQTILDSLEEQQKLPEKTELGNPSEAAEKAAEDEQQRADCSGFKTRTWEIARTDWFPDQRTTWRWTHIKSGCINLHFWTSTTEWRNRDLVAEGWVTIPDGLKPVENAIQQCARESALASAVFFLLFTDLGGALTAFRALFFDCIEGKFNEALSCVNAGIVVDTRWDGDWH
ncbi:hypothetical protein HFN60_30300 [Rhizobium leguminosarum]|uniref:hypothetical protein n=1 Tax=Rhizobium leguminosarum TaxID=384 RepID=UPI001C953CFD|nr:hypothetical protein [Rhizobium leguminosarum]MBY5819886.1 hypothetical protein [Rhizobium leguminosarum]